MASRSEKSARNTAPAKRAGSGLSIVVPLFNEAAGLAALHQRLVAAAKALKKSRGLAIEIVYVDDGSSDDTLKIARKLPAKGADLQVVSLSRNFGKEAALLAGLEYARHNALLFMDGDGQHPPELIERLVEAVACRRQRRGLYREGASLERIGDASPAGQAVLPPAQLRSPAADSGGRRRFPLALAARGRCAEAHAGAQPLLQRTVELDRLPPDGRAL